MFDKDGDGVVSIRDLIKLIKLSGLSFKGDQLGERVKQADVNDDKLIIFSEFESFFESTGRSFGNFGSQKFFSKFDKDGNGFISKAEFRKKMKAVMKKLGHEMNRKDLIEAFDRIDSDEDGKIAFEEFKVIPNIKMTRCPCWLVIAVIILLK